jgi:hypothetical protein
MNAEHCETVNAEFVNLSPSPAHPRLQIPGTQRKTHTHTHTQTLSLKQCYTISEFLFPKKVKALECVQLLQPLQLRINCAAAAAAPYIHEVHNNVK